MQLVCGLWNPHQQSLIKKLEKVQKHATKLVLRHMNIRGPQLFYSFFIRWTKVVRIGALFANWSCAS